VVDADAPLQQRQHVLHLRDRRWDQVSRRCGLDPIKQGACDSRDADLRQLLVLVGQTVNGVVEHLLHQLLLLLWNAENNTDYTLEGFTEAIHRQHFKYYHTRCEGD